MRTKEASTARWLLVTSGVMALLAIVMLGLRIAGRSDLPPVIPLLNLAAALGLLMASNSMRRKSRGG